MDSVFMAQMTVCLVWMFDLARYGYTEAEDVFWIINYTTERKY